MNVVLSERRENSSRVRHPAEDPPLRLDHPQAHFLKLWKIGTHAVRRHKTVVAAVVGLPHRGIDTDLGSYAGHQEFFDARF